jgi:hypothetical protein
MEAKVSWRLEKKRDGENNCTYISQKEIESNLACLVVFMIVLPQGRQDYTHLNKPLSISSDFPKGAKQNVRNTSRLSRG